MAQSSRQSVPSLRSEAAAGERCLWEVPGPRCSGQSRLDSSVPTRAGEGLEPHTRAGSRSFACAGLQPLILSIGEDCLLPRVRNLVPFRC